MSENPEEDPQRRQLVRRKRRRLRVRLLWAAAGAWVLVGVLLFFVEWPGADGDGPYAGGVWDEIRPAPLSERAGTGTVWADDRLVVWGGSEPGADGGPGDGDYFTDGAIWTAGETWLPMPEPPDGLALAPGGFALWDGAEVVFGPVVPADAAERRAAEEPPGLLAYDPAAEEWRRIALDDGVRLHVGPRADEALAGTPAARGHDRPGYDAVVADGVLVLGHDGRAPGEGEGESEGGDGAGAGGPQLLAVDPADGSVRVLDPGPYAAGGSGGAGEDGAAGEPRAVRSLVAAADRVVAISGTGTGSGTDTNTGTGTGTGTGTDAEAAGDRAAWVLDVAAGVWSEGAEPPEPGPADFARAVSDAGSRVYYLDDSAPSVYDVAADAWAAVPEPPRLAEAALRAGADYVWTGDAALAAGRAYDPAAEEWSPSEELPLEEDELLLAPYTGWTGEALVVFGGDRYTCEPDADCEPGTSPETLAGWVYISG